MIARTRTLWAWLGLAALALALRFHGLGWGLPQVYEEAYPFKKSWDMWGWAPGRHFDPNPHFFNYPTFFFYVQLVGQGLLYVLLRIGGAVHNTLDYRVLYALDKTSFYWMGRGISVLFGVATVLVTFVVGRRVGGVAVAVISAALVAVNQMHIAKSQVIEVDVPLTLFVMLCCLYSLRILEKPALANYALAGLFAGLATSTKYSGVLLPLPIFLAHLLAHHGAGTAAAKDPGASRAAGSASARGGGGRGAAGARAAERKGSRDPAPRGSGFALWGAPATSWRNLGLAAIVCVASLFLTSPYILLDRQAFWLGFNYERLHMRIGHFGLDQTPAVLFYLRVMTGSLLGWPLTLVSLAAIVWFAGVKRRPWALVLAVFPVVYLVLISSWHMKADRYILPLLPIAAIFAAQLAAEFAPRLRPWRSWAPAAATAAFVVVLFVPAAMAYWRDLSRLRPDTRTLSKEFIEKNYPSGTYLLTEPYGPEPFSCIDLIGLDLDVRERIQKEHPDAKQYPVLQLEMYQVIPEAAGVFYDLRLYEDLPDVIVTSSSVGSRYRKEPERYKQQLAFYDSLETRYTKVKEFGPADGNGPRITIYRDPHHTVPFSQRKTVPLPRADVGPKELYPGTASAFYQRLGANYEVYGFFDAAALAYSLGLGYPAGYPSLPRDLRLGVIRCLLSTGRTQQALAVVDGYVAQAKTRADAVYFRQLRQQLTSPAPADTAKKKQP
jgi:4-amino-4-deoxy-L-arabinose transferase-like glycosyltransferase